MHWVECFIIFIPISRLDFVSGFPGQNANKSAFYRKISSDRLHNRRGIKRNQYGVADILKHSKNSLSSEREFFHSNPSPAALFSPPRGGGGVLSANNAVDAQVSIAAALTVAVAQKALSLEAGFFQGPAGADIVRQRRGLRPLQLKHRKGQPQQQPKDFGPITPVPIFWKQIAADAAPVVGVRQPQNARLADHRPAPQADGPIACAGGKLSGQNISQSLGGLPPMADRLLRRILPNSRVCFHPIIGIHILWTIIPQDQPRRFYPHACFFLH